MGFPDRYIKPIDTRVRRYALVLDVIHLFKYMNIIYKNHVHVNKYTITKCPFPTKKSENELFVYILLVCGWRVAKFAWVGSLMNHLIKT